MALPTGTISISDINLEQGKAANRNVSVGTLRSEWYAQTGDSDFSGSGPISISAWHGKEWTVPGVPPTGPATLSITNPNAVGLTSIEIMWGSISYHGEQPIRLDLEINGAISQINYAQSGYNVSGLNRGTQYTLRIRAVSQGGTGAWSPSLTRTTITTVTPTIVYAAATVGSYNIQWSHPTGPQDYYEVGAFIGGSWVTNTTTSTSYNDSSSGVKATQLRVRAHYPASGSRPAEFSSYATVNV